MENIINKPVKIDFVLNKNTISHNFIDKIYYMFDTSRYVKWKVDYISHSRDSWIEENESELIVKMKYCTIRYNKIDYVISIEGIIAIMSLGRIDLERVFTLVSPIEIYSSINNILEDKIEENTIAFEKIEFLLHDTGVLYDLVPNGTYCIKPRERD